MFKKSRIPKYRRHPNGQAFIQVKGKRHYLGKYGSVESILGYQQFTALLEKDPSARPDRAEVRAALATFDVQDLCAAYWPWAKRYYRKGGHPSEHLQRVKTSLTILRRLYGKIAVAEFGPLALQTIQAELVRAGRARIYVNALVDTIKRVFKWGAANELVPVAVYQALSTVAGLRRGRTEARETEPIAPVDDPTVDATLPHLPAVVADMVLFQRLTGCRPGEVCQIRPGDIDRSGDVWLYRPGSHKTEHLGRQRVVCIGPRAQEILAPYLLRPADAWCFSPAESLARRHAELREARKTPVQPSQVDRRKARPRRRPGKAYTRHSYCRAIARAVEAANRQAAQLAGDRGPALVIPRWHPHQLRHTRATEIRRMFGLEAAQVTLGHAHAKVTEVYAERDTRLAADIARKIG